MSYIGNSLYEGEELLYRGRFHGFHYAQAWLALIFLGVLIIGIFIFVGLMVKFHTTEFAVTNRRIVYKKGSFTVRFVELELDAIEGGQIRQSLFGRLFGFGDVHITGRGDTDLDLPTMSHPALFLAAAEKAKAEAEGAVFDEVGDQLHSDLERLLHADNDDGDARLTPGGTD